MTPAFIYLKSSSLLRFPLRFYIMSYSCHFPSHHCTTQLWPIKASQYICFDIICFSILASLPKVRQLTCTSSTEISTAYLDEEIIHQHTQIRHTQIGSYRKFGLGTDTFPRVDHFLVLALNRGSRLGSSSLWINRRLSRGLRTDYI